MSLGVASRRSAAGRRKPSCAILASPIQPPSCFPPMTGRQDLFDESMRLGHAAAWDLQWDKAIGYYRKALAEFPDDPDALSHLGLALLETDQLKEALPLYHRAARAGRRHAHQAPGC